jgi:hypothetical protein
MSGFSDRSAANPNDENHDSCPAVGFGWMAVPQVRVTGPASRRALISSPSCREMEPTGMGTPHTTGGEPHESSLL